MKRLRIDLIGGPYDGAPGLYMDGDDDADEAPDVLHVGVCAGRGTCGMSACVRSGVGRHVAYWVDEEGEPPVKTLKYRKADDELEERVRYVFAGMGLPLFEMEFAGVAGNDSWEESPYG